MCGRRQGAPLPLLPTASALPRAMLCPPSVFLPRVDDVVDSEWAAYGNGAHAFMVRAEEVGREAALEEIPADASWRNLCEQIPLEKLPKGGRYEVSLRWNHRTGKARILGYDLKPHAGGTYPPREDAADYDGTADLVATVMLPDGTKAVLVIDFKSGYRRIGLAVDHKQVRFLALAAARALGVDHAIVALVYLRDDGSLPWNEAQLDFISLLQVEEEMVALANEIERSWLRYEAGLGVDVKKGKCTYCPAYDSCPANVKLAGAIVAETQAIVKLVAENATVFVDEGKGLVERMSDESVFSNEAAGVALSRVLLVEELLKRVKPVLKDRARRAPLPHPDGEHEWREVEVPDTALDAAVVQKVVTEKHGEKAGAEVVQLTTSQKAIENVLRPIAKKGKLAAMKRDVLSAVEVAGGLTKTIGTEVKLVPIAATQKALKRAAK